MTTRTFLEAFGLRLAARSALTVERLKAEGLLQRDGGEADLDSALGLADGGKDIDLLPGDAELNEEVMI